jgi:hypothetical protein
MAHLLLHARTRIHPDAIPWSPDPGNPRSCEAHNFSRPKTIFASFVGAVSTSEGINLPDMKKVNSKPVSICVRRKSTAALIRPHPRDTDLPEFSIRVLANERHWDSQPGDCTTTTVRAADIETCLTASSVSSKSSPNRWPSSAQSYIHKTAQQQACRLLMSTIGATTRRISANQLALTFKKAAIYRRF